MFNRLLNRNRNNTNEAQASDNVPEEDNENNIPSVNEWQIEKQFYLEKIAEDLLAISEDRYTGQIKTNYSNHKLLNNPSKDDYEIDPENFNLGDGSPEVKKKRFEYF